MSDNGSTENGKRLPMAGADPVANVPAIDGFPASEKVYVEDSGLRVPMRRVQLTNGDRFDVYDTSGPQGHDPNLGLPKLRQEIGRAHV